MSTTNPPAEPVEGVVDPVCGMTIDPADAVGHFDYEGHTYYFCAESCLEQFRDNPAQFLNPAAKAAAPVDLEAEYTCPMHPEVRQKGPGACPICGMALEPVDVTPGGELSPELEDMTRRFVASFALTAPILAFMIAELLPGRPLDRFIPHGLRNWIEFGLATPVVLWGGTPFFERGWASIATRHLNMFTLI